MTGSFSLIAQHQPVQLLNAIVRREKIPHALLLTGIEGVGKQAAALAFSMSLNCLRREKGFQEGRLDALGQQAADQSIPPKIPCGRCRSCRKIESGSHPDIVRLKPAGAFIRIDQIRELCRILAMKPYEAEYRVALIYDAHRMNPEAGNALLKMLEEPPGQTVLILTATATTDLLPTIVSRCRHIRFSPIPAQDLARELVDASGLDDNIAHTLAMVSGGSLSKANELMRSKWVQRRRWLLDSFFPLISREDDIQAPVRSAAMASMMYSDKDSAVDFLEMLKTIYRDLMIYRHRPEGLLNPDVSETIGAVARSLGETQISDAMKAIDTALERISRNSNARLTMETLFLTLAKTRELN